MYWNRREIKNFRLKNQLHYLDNVFVNTDKEKLFVFIESVLHKDIKKDLAKEMYSLKSFSPKAIKIYAQTSSLKQALLGNVYLILAKNNKKLDIKKILTNRHITLNFLLDNNQLYRNQTDLFKKPIPIATGLSFIQQPILNLLYLLELSKK